MKSSITNGVRWELVFKRLVAAGVVCAFLFANEARSQETGRPLAVLSVDSVAVTEASFVIYFRDETGSRRLRVPHELLNQSVDQGHQMTAVDANQLQTASEDTDSKLFVDAPVPMVGKTEDGRDLLLTVYPGRGVAMVVEDDSLFVPSKELSYIYLMYNHLTGSTPKLSAIGQNETGEYGWFFQGSLSKNAQIGGLLGFGFMLVLAVSLSLLIATRRQRIRLQRTRKKMIKAREAERKHLAAEIHDGPLQDLQYVIRSLAKPQELDGDFTRIVESVSKKLRTICSDLRPEVLAHFGLIAGIEGLVEEFAARYPESHISLKIESDGTSMDYDAELAYFRILQESLSNIAKHAQAAHVDVEFNLNDKWTELIVSDDGIGFEVPRKRGLLVTNGNLGLLGITQRAAILDAALDIMSTSEGTSVKVVGRTKALRKVEGDSGEVAHR